MSNIVCILGHTTRSRLVKHLENSSSELRCLYAEMTNLKRADPQLAISGNIAKAEELCKRGAWSIARWDKSCTRGMDSHRLAQLVVCMPLGVEHCTC
jgi:hypothetical protein